MFNVVYSVLYMFTLINFKERTSNTATVSYNLDSCPIGNSATGNQAFTVGSYIILVLIK